MLTLAAIVFGTMAVAAKTVAHHIPGPEVAFVRFVVGLLACAAVSTRVRLGATNLVGLLLRGAYGGMAVLLYFLAIAHLPVGVATLLNYTAPVFTALYAATVLGEILSRSTALALLVTTCGVALVICGTAPPGSLGLGPWELCGVASAVLSGAAVATIREVRKTDGSWEIFGSLCLVGAAVTALPTLRSWVSPSAAEWWLLALVGVLSVVAQLMMTYSLRFVGAALAGVIGQLSPITAMALGVALFGERYPPLSLLGAGLTLVGVTWGACISATPPGERARA